LIACQDEHPAHKYLHHLSTKVLSQNTWRFEKQGGWLSQVTWKTAVETEMVIVVVPVSLRLTPEK